MKTMKATILGEKIQLVSETFEVGNSFSMRIKENNPRLVGWVYARLQTHEHPVLIDVGAHTGQYTLLAALLPELRVHAFEPVFITTLMANARVNNLMKRVEFYNCALGNEISEGVIHVPNTDREDIPVGARIGSHATMSEEIPKVFGADWHDKQTVISTLDTVCMRDNIEPTLIKIDTEGMDKFVIEGGEETIRKYKPDILVEFVAEHTARFGYGPAQITCLLHSWGYTCKVMGNDAACIHGAEKSEIWEL